MEEFIKTNPTELAYFLKLLTKDRKGYQPFLFPLERQGKDPLAGVSWKNNRKTYNEAMHLMRRGFNIGIAAKPDDPLVIIDVDDMEQVPEIKSTLQCVSRKRIGRHNFFFAADETAKRNIPADTAGEIRSCWQYVVAPGSYVTCSDKDIARMPDDEKVNAGHYSVFKELPVSTISYEEFPEVYKQANNSRKIADSKAAISTVIKKSTATTQTAFKGKKSALWDLTIEDVSGLSDTHGKRVPIPSEIHESGTYKNCSVSEGLLHCWRHEVTHNAFSYLCVLAGVMNCEDAGKQHCGRFFGADAKNPETVLKVWQYAKNRGLIPYDDPFPSREVMMAFAKEMKIVNISATKETKLSELQYNLVKTCAKLGRRHC